MELGSPTCQCVCRSLVGASLQCNLNFERQVYVKALGSFPDRIKNLYFSYLFLLRAVNKVGDVCLNPFFFFLFGFAMFAFLPRAL
jgi:hypothetical protein